MAGHLEGQGLMKAQLVLGTPCFEAFPGGMGWKQICVTAGLGPWTDNENDRETNQGSKPVERKGDSEMSHKQGQRKIRRAAVQNCKDWEGGRWAGRAGLDPHPGVSSIPSYLEKSPWAPDCVHSGLC